MTSSRREEEGLVPWQQGRVSWRHARIAAPVDRHLALLALLPQGRPDRADRQARQGVMQSLNISPTESHEKRNT